MKENTKIYWKGIEQLKNDTEFVKNAEKEFPEYLPISNSDNNEGGNSRRDFLKMMGFGIAAVSLAACESPVRKAIPYLNKPVDVDPGVPNYYASSYINGSDYCSIVVKTREGRPIKIDGNKFSKYSGGGTSAQVEASVLSLYDKQRFQNPMKSGAAVTWDALDAEVTSKLAEIASAGGQIRIVTHSIVSPSTKLAIEKFIAKYPGTQVVTYDAVSYSGMLNANAASFGSRALPFYQFNKAKAIVSIGADFLGTWLNPTLFSRQFAETRKLGPKKKDMSRLYSFETNLSLTGSNADYRTTIKPSEVGTLVGNLYNLVAAKAGVSGITVSKMESPSLTKAANDLWAAKGESLVVCGENDTNVQTIVNAINNLLGNYGTTLSWDAPVTAKQGDDAAMDKFIADLGQGAIGGVIFYNCNPAYDHPKGAAIASGIAKAALSLSTADRPDETNSAVTYIAPDSHFLESWNDAEPAKGHFSLGQPSISNIFNTRQAQQSFLTWSGESVTYLDFIKENWKNTLFAGQTEELDFQMFWDKCLYNGVYSAPVMAAVAAPVFAGNADAAASSVAAKYKAGGAIELSVYESIALGAGDQANNPWLQEMPDPISKVCWENYISMSQSMATELGIEMKEGFTTKATLDLNGTSVVLPVVVQPGQAAGTIGVALGYGRTKAGKVADGVGVNAYAFLSASADGVSYSVFSGVSVTPTGEQYRIAQTQTHQTYMGRETVIQEATLSDYKADASAGRYKPMIATATGLRKPDSISLWKGHEYANHHWAMVIDLNSCTGCGSCTVACQVENNIPVVGKQEVVNRREMSWLRIDRYYSSQGSKEDKTMQGLSLLEKAAENPEVTFQPMMCQQCNNAPCETVCPVAATTHSTEGLNQMTYNRCIGTRYCANNCPFKVRRFNWFKYHDNRQFPDNTSMNNELGKMVLNPDVTVRARGVMEKCSFCVQRIQAGKLSAKKEGRRPVDGDVSTACASACPSEAIVFGDLKDQNSQIAQLLKLSANEEGDVVVTEERAYNVLEEIGVKPNVWYLTKIRNKELTDNQA